MMIQNTKENKFEFSVNPKDAIIVERAFNKHTKLDLEIQNTEIIIPLKNQTIV